MNTDPAIAKIAEIAKKSKLSRVEGVSEAQPNGSLQAKS